MYFDEKGSKDLSEFLGRAGVSLVKAGITAMIGTAIAAAAAAVLVAAGVPVLVVVAVAILGYIATAILVDFIDDSFKIKERAAAAAK